MAATTATNTLKHQQLNTDHDAQTKTEAVVESKDEEVEIKYQAADDNTTDPFHIDLDAHDPFVADAATKSTKLEVISDAPMHRSVLKKQLTLYSTMQEMNEPLPLPYNKRCHSRIAYSFETFLVVHPRIYALYLLYSATWPRGLVLLDMYTDVAVALSLYQNAQTFWFMLSSLFVVLPFVLVWTVSLRFIQKFINHLYSQKYHNKCMESVINFGLLLYIFPPIGCVFVAFYEVYLVIYDIVNGLKCFILGTGLVETQTNDVRAMKQYRRAVEIFSESVPQTLLQLYMFWRNVEVNKQDLYLSLAISTFNLLINAYRFRKEAKIHGMFIAEYALSVLQLAEIPIVRLVPRLPAIKKGKLEFINFAGFVFDKESITPIIEALNEVRCVLNTMKISIGSLLNLDLESCRLMGRILKDARIRVFASRTFSLLHIKNLFEEMDGDNNGYLDEKEFCNALKSLNSGLMHMGEKQQKRIFQKLAIRRIKQRDRVYFYDFFKNTASVENKSLEFDITQMDFPLHYVFQHLIAAIDKETNIGDAMQTMEKLYYFCAGLNCFDQIDRSMNNHIFFTIIDALHAIDSNDKIKKGSNAQKFVMKCFHEIIESEVIISDAPKLLEMRNSMFEKDSDHKKYKEFVHQMGNETKYNGLNIFEYCFAFKWHATSGSSHVYVFVYLLNLYLKTKNRYLLQQNEEELKRLYEDKDGPLYHIYNASQFLWTPDSKLPITHAAKHGLFEVVKYFCTCCIKDYNEEQLYKVCVELLRNEDYQSPDTFAVLLKHAQDNGMELVQMESKSAETMDIILLKTQKHIERKQVQNAVTKSQSNEISNELLRYLEILSEYGFDFSTHATLQEATRTKSYDIMAHIIKLSREKSFDCVIRLLNESNGGQDTPIMVACNKNDLNAITLLLECPEQQCNELFALIERNLKYQIHKHLWIKFMFDIITNHKDIDIVKRIKYEVKKEIYDTLTVMLNNSGLEDDAIIKTKTIVSDNATKSSVMNNILRFRNIFGQHKNDAGSSTNPMSEDQPNERVSFRKMAAIISAAMIPLDSDRISKTEPDKKEDSNQKPTAARDLDACQKLCDQLRGEINLLRETSDGMILSTICSDTKVVSYQPTVQRVYKGHQGKIYALNWSSDNKYIVTASQDGKLIIWEVKTGNKKLAITLNSKWVMTCAFSPSSNYIGSGGLDRTVSIYKVGSRLTQKDLYCELEKHDGYISRVAFIDENRILSASGDGTCLLWDMENRAAIGEYTDHTGDVMAIDLNESNPAIFVSASVDATVKMWDIRAKEGCIATFPGHTSDVNAVKWFRNEYGIVSGSDDGTVRLFDMRSYKQMNKYEDPANRSLHSQDPAGLTSVDVSISGQYIFAAYDNGKVYMWSSLTADKICEMPHDSRVSALQLSSDGYALATACWDFNLRIFA